jgi:2-polyprenyl-3-methyl-5-hydroxy-6-metoxy-1,4-benzoquinol methylase
MPSRDAIACAVCDALDVRPLYRKFDLTVSQCTSCGLVFATPRASREEIWGRYNPSYFWDEYLPSHGVIDGRVDLQALDREHAGMLQMIGARVRPPARMLEVGTGAGLFLKAAERAGWTCAGVEVSSDAVDFAVTRLGLDVRQAAAEDSVHADASFDVAVMFEVIEHLLDPRRALASVWRALRPGGYLAMSTPNFDALSRRVLGQQWAVISPGEHLYYFTEKTLHALLLREGFTDVTFVRQFPGLGVAGTMNAGCTHDPSSARARIYRHVVRYCGRGSAGFIRQVGLGDTLLCLATRPRM